MNLISQINVILKKFETGDKLESYKELHKIFKKNKDNNLLRYNLAVIQQNLNFNKEARINYNHLIKVEKNLKAMINLYNMDITEANYYEAFNTIENTYGHVALIIDKKNKLIGLVTDGDLRRELKYRSNFQNLN